MARRHGNGFVTNASFVLPMERLPLSILPPLIAEAITKQYPIMSQVDKSYVSAVLSLMNEGWEDPSASVVYRKMYGTNEFASKKLWVKDIGRRVRGKLGLSHGLGETPRNRPYPTITACVT